VAEDVPDSTPKDQPERDAALRALAVILAKVIKRDVDAKLASRRPVKSV
jgi:hypothetical protein